jgi:hypothetical protein
VPVVGESRQPSTFIIVDLPEPEGPISATYSLATMLRSTSASAVSVVLPIWYVLPMPRSSITANYFFSGGGLAGFTLSFSPSSRNSSVFEGPITIFSPAFNPSVIAM